MTTGLIDTRALGQLRRFRGHDSDWTLWVFQAESYFGIAPRPVGLTTGIDELLETSVTTPMTNLDESCFGPLVAEVAATIFHVLVQSCEWKALTVARRAPRRNGFMLWRMLHEEYAPNVGGRTTAVLS